MSEAFQGKDPIDVSLYLKDNGMTESICEVFEGTFKSLRPILKI